MDCPICQKPLTWVKGTALNPNDGITVYCANKDCIEVFGHSHNEADAFEIIKQKYKPITNKYF